MGEPLNEFDAASYQLMMDIQTGRMVNPSRPARGWMLFGLGAVVLGGLTWLLLVIGNPMSQPTTLPHDVMSTATERTPHPVLGGSQNLTEVFRGTAPLQEEAPLVYKSLQEPISADTQGSSNRKAGRRGPSLSSSTMSPYAPRAAYAPPARVSKRKRAPDRLGKGRSERVVQRQSPPLPVRSLESEFDPNADLVRSAP